MIWNVARGFTWLPKSVEPAFEKATSLTGAAVGFSLAYSNPLRDVLMEYIYGAGIESGYGFFAPAVPATYKLVFELHYDDGHIEYELPRVGSAATGLRFTAVLDYIADVGYPPLRELILKMLAYSAWHSGVTSIRAVYGYISEPTRTEATHGQKDSYEVVYVYDFSFPREQADRPTP